MSEEETQSESSADAAPPADQELADVEAESAAELEPADAEQAAEMELTPAEQAALAAAGKLSDLARRVEALLLASDEPLTPSKLTALTGGGRKEIRSAVESLNRAYDRRGHSFRIEQIAEGYQMLTLGEFNDLLEQLLSVRKDSKLSQAALEALAVVAYKQPVTRADVEVVRGVACGEILRSLMEKRLVKIVGRAEILGRPMLYGTTRRFLEIFGLRALEDLPKAEQLKDPDTKAVGPQEEPAAASNVEIPAAGEKKN